MKMKPATRPVFPWILAAAALALLASPAFGLSPTTPTISAVERKVEQRKTVAKMQWQPAKVKTPLLDGEGIRTGDHARAELMYADGTLSRLAPNTVLTVDAKNNDRTLKVTLGKIWMKVVKGQGRTRVLTPSAVATVVGTELIVDVSAGGSQIQVLEGQVDVASLDTTGTTGQSVSITQGQQATVGDSGGPVNVGTFEPAAVTTDPVTQNVNTPSEGQVSDVNTGNPVANTQTTVPTNAQDLAGTLQILIRSDGPAR